MDTKKNLKFIAKPLLVLVGFTLLALLFPNCENQEDKVVPKESVKLDLGYSGPVDGAWTFVNFNNQEKMTGTAFQSYTTTNKTEEGLMISLRESNLKCKSIGVTGPGSVEAEIYYRLIFNFGITTHQDKETFITRKNGFVAGGGGGTDADNNFCGIEVAYLIPLKYSSLAIPNNDTLEVNLAVDTIRIDYQSLYSSNAIKAKLILYSGQN